MSPARARRIIGMLGWNLADFIAELNRVSGAVYRHGDVWKWFHGARGVPRGAAIFLRLATRIAILERRCGGPCAARRGGGSGRARRIS